jgi:hypothetical protein
MLLMTIGARTSGKTELLGTNRMAQRRRKPNMYEPAIFTFGVEQHRFILGRASCPFAALRMLSLSLSKATP